MRFLRLGLLVFGFWVLVLEFKVMFFGFRVARFRCGVDASKVIAVAKLVSQLLPLTQFVWSRELSSNASLGFALRV